MQVCIQKDLGKIYDGVPEPGKIMYFVKAFILFFAHALVRPAMRGKEVLMRNPRLVRWYSENTH